MGRGLARSDKQLLGVVAASVIAVGSLVWLASSPLGHPAPLPPAVRSMAAPTSPRTANPAQIQASIRVATKPVIHWSHDGRRLLVRADGLRVYDRWGTNAATLPGDDAVWFDDTSLLTWRDSPAPGGAVRDLAITWLDGRSTSVPGEYRQPIVGVGAGAAALSLVSPHAGGGSAFVVLSKPASGVAASVEVSVEVPGEPVSWSPAGDRLVAVRNVPGTGRRLAFQPGNWSMLEAYAVPDLRLLSTTFDALDATQPLLWSPAGTRIAFVRNTSPGATEAPGQRDSGAGDAVGSYDGVAAATDSGSTLVVWKVEEGTFSEPEPQPGQGPGQSPIGWSGDGLYYVVPAAPPPGSVRLWSVDGAVVPTSFDGERAALGSRSPLQVVVPTSKSPASLTGRVEILGRGGVRLLDAPGIVDPDGIAATGDAVAVTPPGAGDILIVTVPELRVAPSARPDPDPSVLPQVAVLQPPASFELEGLPGIVAAHGHTIVLARETLPRRQVTLLVLDLLTRKEHELTRNAVGRSAAMSADAIVWFEHAPGLTPGGWRLMTVGLDGGSKRQLAAGGPGADAPIRAAHADGSRAEESRNIPLAIDGDKLVYPLATRGGSFVVELSIRTGKILRMTELLGPIGELVACHGAVAWRSQAEGTAEIHLAVGARDVLLARDGYGLGCNTGGVAYGTYEGMTSKVVVADAGGATTVLFQRTDDATPASLGAGDDAVVWARDVGGTMSDSTIWWRPGQRAPVEVTGLQISFRAALTVSDGYLVWAEQVGVGGNVVQIFWVPLDEVY